MSSFPVVLLDPASDEARLRLFETLATRLRNFLEDADQAIPPALNLSQMKMLRMCEQVIRLTLSGYWTRSAVALSDEALNALRAAMNALTAIDYNTTRPAAKEAVDHLFDVTCRIIGELESISAQDFGIALARTRHSRGLCDRLGVFLLDNAANYLGSALSVPTILASANADLINEARELQRIVDAIRAGMLPADLTPSKVAAVCEAVHRVKLAEGENATEEQWRERFASLRVAGRELVRG